LFGLAGPFSDPLVLSGPITERLILEVASDEVLAGVELIAGNRDDRRDLLVDPVVRAVFDPVGQVAAILDRLKPILVKLVGFLCGDFEPEAIETF
jgi:hypothetical protein